MKYQKPFLIRDNPAKIYLRVSIIKDFLQGMSLTNISKKENCTIKTVKKWNQWRISKKEEKKNKSIKNSKREKRNSM